MKLAVIGTEGKSRRSVVRRGQSSGYDVIDCDSHMPNFLKLQFIDNEIKEIIKRADAVLLLLHEELNLFDRVTAKYLAQLIPAMQEQNIRRFILFSAVDFSLDYSFTNSHSSLEYIRNSKIDWTVIGHNKPALKDSKFHSNIAKLLVSEVTDNSNLNSIVLLPHTKQQLS
jgi:hypothetical protein